MKNIIMEFITWIESGLARLKVDLQAIGSALVPAIEQAFTAAEQEEIAALIPDATNIVNGLNAGDNPKELFATALAALETSLIAAGKTFVLTFATQALTIAINNLKGNNGDGNGGNVTQNAA